MAHLERGPTATQLDKQSYSDDVCEYRGLRLSTNYVDLPVQEDYGADENWDHSNQ